MYDSPLLISFSLLLFSLISHHTTQCCKRNLKGKRDNEVIFHFFICIGETSFSPAIKYFWIYNKNGTSINISFSTDVPHEMKQVVTKCQIHNKLDLAQTGKKIGILQKSITKSPPIQKTVSLADLVPLAEQLHIHTLEDWYKVPKEHLKQVGGAKLLQSYLL